jgi:hypothetical protein
MQPTTTVGIQPRGLPMEQQAPGRAEGLSRKPASEWHKRRVGHPLWSWFRGEWWQTLEEVRTKGFPTTTAGTGRPPPPSSSPFVILPLWIFQRAETLSRWTKLVGNKAVCGDQESAS